MELNLSPEHRADLQKKSGLTDETITAANIHSIPPCDIQKILGKGYADKVNSLLAFPYQQNGFCRYKLFPPIKDKDGHKIKYFQAPGSGVHLYYPPGIENDISDPSIPLSIVEGEKKALKGHQEGIVSTGIGGIWNFKEKGSDELAPDFDSIPLSGRVVNLIPDGDYHKNKDVQRAVLSLAQKLKEKGATPYLISLPDGEEKIGLDDFLVQYGVSEFWDLPREEIKTDPYERLNLPSSLEISRLEIKVDWIVKNLIPKESITLLHSIGGVGKSYLMYGIAQAVANGEPFFGLDVMRMNVYYIDFENPLPEIVDRMKKMGGSQDLKIWHLGHDPMPVRFDSDQWEIYKTFPPGLFIIDSLRSSHLLEENSSKDASFIMARHKEIRALGNTIILIHHENKLGGYRGSTAWFDLSDHILKFSRVKKVGSDEDAEEDDFDLPIRLGLRGKSRFSSAMELKPMYFRFENHQLCSADDPDDEILNKMADLLNPISPPNQSEFQKLVKENLGLGQKDFRKLLKKGEDRNLWYAKRAAAGNKLEYFRGVKVDAFFEEHGKS
jgi:hypothetical protein